MKKIFSLIILFSFSRQVLGQTNSCACSAYLDSKVTKSDTVNTQFYKSWDAIMKKYSDGCDDIKILKDSANYLLIQPYYLIPKHKNEKMWIKNNNQFLVNPRGPFDGYFILYDNHDLKSKKNFTEKSSNVSQIDFSMTVISCYKTWLKVSLKYKGKTYIGWTKDFCPLGCTTCT